MEQNSGRKVCPAKTIRYLGVPLSEHSVIDRKITVAAGVYAPGHLGELTLWGSKRSSLWLTWADLVPGRMVGHHLDLWRFGCCTTCSAVSAAGWRC